MGTETERCGWKALMRKIRNLPRSPVGGLYAAYMHCSEAKRMWFGAESRMQSSEAKSQGVTMAQAGVIGR